MASNSILSKQITLVTGANQGIGLATVKALATQYPDYHVIVGSRNAEAGAKVASELSAQGHSVSSVQLELTSQESIDNVVEHIKTTYGRLDVLINNAGILWDGKRPDLTTRQLYEQTFAINVVGPACLTEGLLPLLEKSDLPKIVFVSTRMGSLWQAMEKNTPFYNIDYKVYDASKAATNMLALNYARILEDKGGLVNCVCPGLVKTNLTNYQFGTSPEVGAKHVVAMATLAKGGPTKTFSDVNGPIPW